MPRRLTTLPSYETLSERRAGKQPRSRRGSRQGRAARKPQNGALVRGSRLNPPNFGLLGHDRPPSSNPVAGGITALHHRSDLTTHLLVPGAFTPPTTYWHLTHAPITMDEWRLQMPGTCPLPIVISQPTQYVVDVGKSRSSKPALNRTCSHDSPMPIGRS